MHFYAFPSDEHVGSLEYTWRDSIMDPTFMIICVQYVKN